MAGKFRAQTYAGGMAIPLGNVAVTIRSSDGTLVSFRKTDINGFTDIIDLEAPPEGLSLTPGNEQPYATYNVSVDYPGYYGVLIKGVQVFSGKTTWQQVEMLPLPDNKEQVFKQVTITPGTL